MQALGGRLGLPSSWLVVIVGLAGCYSPSYSDCAVRCSVSGTCPSGLSCDGVYCRAPGGTQSCSSILTDGGAGDAETADGNPNLDSDGDGVMDDVDNCRSKSNSDQANEDNDAFGDVCDPCPPFRTYLDVNQQSQDANVDSDGDGVGDGCDRNPMAPGERIVLFEGFHSPINAGVVETVGTWNIVSGRAVSTYTGTPSLVRWMMPPIDFAKGEMVQAAFTIDMFAAGNNQHQLAGVIELAPSNQGAGCLWGFAQSMAPRLALAEVTQTNDTLINSQPLQTAPQAPASTIIELTRRGGANVFTCRSPDAPIANGNVSTTVANGSFGLRARGVNVGFDWILVVESPQ